MTFERWSNAGHERFAHRGCLDDDGERLGLLANGATGIDVHIGKVDGAREYCSLVGYVESLYPSCEVTAPRFHSLRRVSTQQESCTMLKDIFPQTTPEIAARRRQLAPDIHDAFKSFRQHVYAGGALPVTTTPLTADAPHPA